MPRQINPSPAAMRAAKVIQELLARANQDTQGRIAAEQKLTEAFGDIQRLTKELQDAKETINKLTAGVSDTASRSKPSVPEATTNTDEVSSG